MKAQARNIAVAACLLLSAKAFATPTVTADEMDDLDMLRAVICAAEGPTCHQVPEKLSPQQLRDAFDFADRQAVLTFLSKLKSAATPNIKSLSGETTAWLTKNQLVNLTPAAKNDGAAPDTPTVLTADKIINEFGLRLVICAAGGPACDGDMGNGSKEALEMLGLKTAKQAYDLLKQIDRGLVRKLTQQVLYDEEVSWLNQQGFDLGSLMGFSRAEVSARKFRVFAVRCWGPYISATSALEDVFLDPEIVVGVDYGSDGRPVLNWVTLPHPPTCDHEAVPVGDYQIDLGADNDGDVLHFISPDRSFRILLSGFESKKFSSFTIERADGQGVVQTSNKNWFGAVPDPVNNGGEIAERKLIRRSQ
ncbi:hypothetical protein ACFQ14_12900 [Pseudahrensia aquimaris]|uniref:Uncharacterized protein n=1 Tax=Pseudahrensia aquimaris TaxID=744461 RepID=A0ABW3FMD3_9HYPH